MKYHDSRLNNTLGERSRFDPGAEEAFDICETPPGVETRTDSGTALRAGGGQGRQERGCQMPKPIF